MNESDERITRAAAKLKRMQDSGEAWAARQAVGDAVLLLLRDGKVLTAEALLEHLRAMAQGMTPGWRGHASVALRAIELIRQPPAALPQMSAD